MTAQTANKVTVPVGSDAWNLTTHLKGMAETTSSLIPVASVAERDALAALFPGGVLPIPTMITRTDEVGSPNYQWNGSIWLRKSPQTWRFERDFTSDSNPGDITGTTQLKTGTITAAPAGLYRIAGRACLYADSGVYRGFVYVKAGASTEEARNDRLGDGTPHSMPVEFEYQHAGGNLTVEIGYRVTSGQPRVTGKASGLTRVIATLIGN